MIEEAKRPVPQDDTLRNSDDQTLQVPPHAHCWYCNAVVPPAPDHHQVQVPMVQMTPQGPDVKPWWVAVWDKHYEERKAADAAAAKQLEQAARAAAVNKGLVVARGPVRKV